MSRNEETLEHVRALIEERRLRGKVVLHCSRGVIHDTAVEERLEPPWKARDEERVASSGGNAL